MTYVQHEIENAAVGVAVMDKLEEFDVFRKPGVAASVWRRQLPEDFQLWIDTLEVEKLPSARIIVHAEVVRDAVEVICDKAGIPNNLMRRTLVDDVVLLSDEFAKLMDTKSLRLRFDVVQDNACEKFHIDAITARLVCTYRGMGTQYGISTDGLEPKRIYTVPTGAPMLLRGSKWPEPPHSGILHRSPQIEGTGMTRLVLVIDPIAEEESQN